MFKVSLFMDMKLTSFLFCFILSSGDLYAETAAVEIVSEVKSELGLRQTKIKGLLVVELNNGDLAGTASQMNATAMNKGSGFVIQFNQEVGEMMKGATEEVDKFIRVRYPESLPDNTLVELSFADKYTPKDGPSAAVVCALMVDSIISGNELDPGFAATGDMTATGEVQPVGGVPSKVKGAIRKKCTHIAIPLANKNSIIDESILKGLESLHQIQIFTIEDFEQAHALASSERPEDIQTAIDEFALVQKALKKNPKYIYNSQVREKLSKIIELAPNHLSAGLLHLYSNRNEPKKLSIAGSIRGLDNAGAKLGNMMENGSYIKAQGLGNDVLAELVTEMNRLRPKLDKRTIDYSDSYVDIANFIKKHRGRKRFTEQLVREINQLSSKIDQQRDTLINRSDVQEELME